MWQQCHSRRKNYFGPWKNMFLISKLNTKWMDDRKLVRSIKESSSGMESLLITCNIECDKLSHLFFKLTTGRRYLMIRLHVKIGDGVTILELTTCVRYILQSLMTKLKIMIILYLKLSVSIMWNLYYVMN